MLMKSTVMAVLAAEEIQRAVEFYRDALGLKSVETGIDGHSIFEVDNGGRFLIYQRERTKAEHTVLEFLVDDIETVVKELTEKGVSFEQYDFENLKTNELGIAQLGDRRAAWFVDPEGNIVSIST